jgi:Mrp family chromosome partitioning ATPase
VLVELKGVLGPQLRELAVELRSPTLGCGTPLLRLVADALELARMVDGVVLVVRSNSASTDEAREVRSVVERLGIHLVGVVLTDVEPPASYYSAYSGQRARAAQKAVPEASEPVAEEF